MLKTPDGRIVSPEQVSYDEDGRPFTYEWFDGVMDLYKSQEEEWKQEREDDKSSGVGSFDINFKKVEESEAARLALESVDEDYEQVNRLAPVKNVWRPMVLREFTYETHDKVSCACRTFTPNVSAKTGKELKSGKWSTRPDCPLCAGRGNYKGNYRTETNKRWARLKPFKASKDQLIRYMQWRGHKVPLNQKKKETTAAKEIDRLAKKTGDSLYVNVLVRRAVDKVDGTYCMGFTPWEDGRVHSEFAYGPASGQLNSRRPNVQNLPKHIRYERLKPLDLPKRFRRLIKARPGHKIWEFDYKSFHILTLGFNARDAAYMRMARLDMHSHFSSYLLTARGVIKEPISKALSDSDLKAALKDIKSAVFLKLNGSWQRATEHLRAAYATETGWSCESIIVKELRDQQAKPAILGKGLGMSAYRLYMENQEYFSSKAAAVGVMAAYDAAWPLEIEFQNQIALKAHNDKYLISKHWFIRRFWDVFHFLYYPDGHYDTSNGEDHEAAIAFHVQNDAFGHIRMKMKDLDKEGLLDELQIVAAPPSAIAVPEWMKLTAPKTTFKSWNDAAQLINTVHDSLVFEIPNELDNVAPAAIKKIMERPSPILVDDLVAPNGLYCDVEVSNGLNWADLKEVFV